MFHPTGQTSMLAQPKILIADDIEANVRSLTEIVRQEHFQVLTACDGYEALKIAERDLPDIILLDAMIPIIDGCQVIKKLKNTTSTASIPIILIIALNDSNNRKKGLDAGAEEILNKPVIKTL